MKQIDCLPVNYPLRVALHHEVHARPPARIRLPALITYVAVINEGVEPGEELAHLRRLPGQGGLSMDQVASNFVRLRLAGCTVKWERHAEFSRYSVVQPLDSGHQPRPVIGNRLEDVSIDGEWLRQIPGQTIAAVLMMLEVEDESDGWEAKRHCQRWFPDAAYCASVVGATQHSVVASDFKLHEDGFVRMHVVCRREVSETLPGRIAQRLLEIETYRLLALRGYAEARAIAGSIADMEKQLSGITDLQVAQQVSDKALLATLMALSGRVEQAIANSAYRLSATKAYSAIVDQRIKELREGTVPGVQNLGQFLQKRLQPAMATVLSTSDRLHGLSERVTRAASLLRTHVDVATEERSQQLLEKLNQGQQLQLHLQTTVEGLSIAAISYYVVGLLSHTTGLFHWLGWPVDGEQAVSLAVPLVVSGVWLMQRRIHRRLSARVQHGSGS